MTCQMACGRKRIGIPRKIRDGIWRLVLGGRFWFLGHCLRLPWWVRIGWERLNGVLLRQMVCWSSRDQICLRWRRRLESRWFVWRYWLGLRPSGNALSGVASILWMLWCCRRGLPRKCCRRNSGINLFFGWWRAIGLLRSWWILFAVRWRVDSWLSFSLGLRYGLEGEDTANPIPGVGVGAICL